MQENKPPQWFQEWLLMLWKQTLFKKASKSSSEFREPFSLSVHTTFRKLNGIGRCYESFLYWDLILSQKSMEIRWEAMQVSGLLKVIHTLMGYREKWQRVESTTFTAVSTALLCCPAETRTYVIPKKPLRYKTIDLYWNLRSYSSRVY